MDEGANYITLSPKANADGTPNTNTTFSLRSSTEHGSGSGFKAFGKDALDGGDFHVDLVGINSKFKIFNDGIEIFSFAGAGAGAGGFSTEGLNINSKRGIIDSGGGTIKSNGGRISTIPDDGFGIGGSIEAGNATFHGDINFIDSRFTRRPGPLYSNAQGEISTTNPSDIALKDRVQRCYQFDYGLKEILSLMPQRFNFIGEAEGVEPHYGYFAQEVRDVLPGFVGEYNDGDGVQRLSLVNDMPNPVTVNAIHELYGMIMMLQNTRCRYSERTQRTKFLEKRRFNNNKQYDIIRKRTALNPRYSFPLKDFDLNNIGYIPDPRDDPRATDDATEGDVLETVKAWRGLTLEEIVVEQQKKISKNSELIGALTLRLAALGKKTDGE